jgi:hypothetical protein
MSLDRSNLKLYGANQMRTLLAALATTVTIALPSAFGQAQPSEPKWPTISSETKGNVTNALVMDPMLAAQARNFATLRKIPSMQNPVVVPWLMARAQELDPGFLYEIARRLWDMGRRNDAFEWFALAHVRARYDAARCVDKTAPQGIFALPQIAANVQAGMRQLPADFSAAGLRAIARPDAFSGTVSPWGICAHGMNAVMAGIEKKSIDEAAWLKPQGEWEKLRADVKQQLTAFFVEFGKPQDDPIPMSKNAHKVTPVAKGSLYQFVWLDNERLVFDEPVRGSKPYATILRQWKSDGAIDEIARAGGTWCAGSGVIAFVKGNEGKLGELRRVTYAVGEPGKTNDVTMEFDGYFKVADMVHSGASGWTLITVAARQSPYDCRWVTSDRLSGDKKGANWQPLLPGHGFVSLTGRDGQPAQKILYYPTETAEPVELLIPTKNISLHAIRYFPFKGAYFISPAELAPSAERKPNCTSVWWFVPQGVRTEEVCVPVDAVNSNSFVYWPSRAGILRAVTRRETAQGTKPGGIYLQARDGRSEKIFEAALSAISVSPDGCKVAVMENTSIIEKSLSVIELCAADRSPNASKAR